MNAAVIVSLPVMCSRLRSDRRTVQVTVTVTSPPGTKSPVSGVMTAGSQLTDCPASAAWATWVAWALAAWGVRASDAARAACWAALSTSSLPWTSRPAATANSNRRNRNGVTSTSSAAAEPRSRDCGERARGRAGRTTALTLARLRGRTEHLGHDDRDGGDGQRDQ